jgi:D-amino-acid dehydrogenase
VLDIEYGYVLAPMTRGIRLTTGAEFAPRDAPPTPVQLAKVEPIARGLFPLAERVDEKPWIGARPCLPDMLPMIGPIPGRKGLWADFAHHHLGFTLGPVSGRLLAEMMTGEATFTDPSPYRIDRFS